MHSIHIRHWLTGKVLWTVDVDRKVPLFPADLRGANLTNLDLRGAALQGANLEGAVLIGTNFEGADLQLAKLKGADLRYANLANADLRGADLTDADCYPVNVSKTKLWGAKITPGSDVESLSKLSALQYRWKT
jgi:uncharacterized protein YjbI with pentapeptide repeats